MGRNELEDKVVKPALAKEVEFKAGKVGGSLRVVVITGNAKKFEEFRAHLGDGYGIDVEQKIPDPALNLNDEQTLTDVCGAIMADQKTSPHFILREDTSLKSMDKNEDLTLLPLADLAKRELESVLHTSSLNVYKPQWDQGKPKKLLGFTLREYEKRSYGYIKAGGTAIENKHGFGWDSLFVNAGVNLTNEEFFEKYGKKSARQHTMSVFIETYLRYKALKALKHHNLPATRPIDFGDNYISLPDYIKGEKHLSNPHIADWGIENLRNAMVNEGMFFKGAWSRPVKNYFSPPFSGLPLTEKKDEAEETIFGTHDKLHHLICDLIFNMPPTKEVFNLYCAWRMMSEACTLVLADMLYAHGLIKMGVDRSCVDKRIYPLFEAIKKAQNIPDPTLMAKEDKMKFIKSLLSANIKYALLGDDSEWRKLLEVNGVIDPESEERLKAYKDHFGKFFIGDNAWTRANFDNMQKNKESLNQWIKDIGEDTFRKAKVPLLSDVYKDMKEKNVPLDNYKELVPHLFNYIFENRIRPHLEKDKVEFEDNPVIQSLAFRRFLMGQASLFSRYPTPFNLEGIRSHILNRLKEHELFSNEEQDKIRKMLHQYILGIEGMRLMSREEALNAIDCTPVFPPVYIAYPAMQKKYGTIENCVSNCVESYQTPGLLASSQKAGMMFSLPLDDDEAELPVEAFMVRSK